MNSKNFCVIVKAIVFGFTIGLVGCYQWYDPSKGKEGVGKAANSAVVIGVFLVFLVASVIAGVSGYFILRKTLH